LIVIFEKVFEFYTNCELVPFFIYIDQIIYNLNFFSMLKNMIILNWNINS